MVPAELSRLGDEALLAKLRGSQEQLCSVYGAQLELLGELLARNLAPALGYKNAERLLQDLLRIGPGEAGRRVRHARAVTAMPSITGPPLPALLPAVAEVVTSGTIGAEHVEVIHRVMSELPAEVAEQDRQAAERTLAQAAAELDPVAVAKLGRAIVARLDQDGRPPGETAPRDPGNELRWSPRRDGGIELKGRLGVEGAALLSTVLSPLARPRPATNGQPDPRCRAERYGDALVDALRLAAASGKLPAEGGERPTLVVTVSLDNLRDQTERAAPALLGGSTLIDASLARRLACDSAVIPAVLGSRSEPLDIGRKTRVVPISLRRALVLRDGGCAFPACVTSDRWCDAHHLHPWANGGHTALPNLVLLCSTHHDLVHRSDWHAIMQDGRPAFVPPAYIDPTQRPRRNTVHDGSRTALSTLVRGTGVHTTVHPPETEPDIPVPRRPPPTAFAGTAPPARSPNR